MKTIVIIITFNGQKWIKKSIQSVLDSSIDVEILVIDNKSTDNTLQIINENFKDQVVLIKNNANLGFGKANNIGLTYALKNNAVYVFLLNQDAYVKRNTIENLISISKNNLDYGILSPIHFNGDGSRLDKNFSNYVSYDRNKNFYGDFIKKEVKDIYDVPFVNAAAWLIPKKTIENIGGFDPIFYHYGEDDNYCQRVLYHGLKIGVVSDAIVYHDREQRTPKTIDVFSKQYLLNYERKLKIRFADINNESSLKDIYVERKVIIFSIIKSIVRLRFKYITGYLKQYLIFKSTLQQIGESRKNNVVKGTNYL